MRRHHLGEDQRSAPTWGVASGTYPLCVSRSPENAKRAADGAGTDLCLTSLDELGNQMAFPLG